MEKNGGKMASTRFDGHYTLRVVYCTYESRDFGFCSYERGMETWKKFLNLFYT